MFLWILRVVALLFLIWFIAPIFKNYFNHGNKLGIIICLFVLLFYTNTPVFEYVRSFCHSYPILTYAWNIGKWLIYTFIAYAVVVTLAMIIASRVNPKSKATAILLGNRATKDGPSDLLKGRITATKAYLDSSTDTVAVLSGGKTKKDYVEEAVCAYETLADLGVNTDRLIIEDKSLSTHENILFSCRIINDLQKEKNLAIVTDSFHQLRARLIIRKLGIKAHIGAVNAKTCFLYIPTYYVREWIALPFELLFRFRPHR